MLCNASGTPNNPPPQSMIMNIVTWNVQGLRSPPDQQNRWKLRRDLEEYILGGVADIVMLQEHHLNSTRSKEVKDLLLGSWRTIWELAIGEDGNHGGICILIRETSSPRVNTPRITYT